MSERTNFSKILVSSEMYCSLKLEDFRGCPYGMFDGQSTAALASSCVLLAFISLLLGIR